MAKKLKLQPPPRRMPLLLWPLVLFGGIRNQSAWALIFVGAQVFWSAKPHEIWTLWRQKQAAPNIVDMVGILLLFALGLGAAFWGAGRGIGVMRLLRYGELEQKDGGHLLRDPEGRQPSAYLEGSLQRAVAIEEGLLHSRHPLLGLLSLLLPLLVIFQNRIFLNQANSPVASTMMGILLLLCGLLPAILGLRMGGRR